MKKLQQQQTEKRIALMCRQDGIRENTIKQLKEENLHKFCNRLENLADEKRFNRRLALEAKERELEENLEYKTQLRHQLKQQEQQAESLAKELKRRNDEVFRDEKLRQQIRQNSLEIRELEEKLRLGYLNKVRAAQIAEKLANEFDSQKADNLLVQEMRDNLKRAEEDDQMKEEQRILEKRLYQEQLDQQMEEQKEKKRLMYEEFLKEKLMIDEIVRKIHEEDQKERECQLEKKRVTQAYIEEYLHNREVWKAEEKQKMEAENQRIMEFSRVVDDRENRYLQEKAERDAVQAKIYQALSEKITEREQAEKELERIRLELHFEEQEEKARQNEKAALEKKLRQRLELQKMNEEQLSMKALKKMTEDEEERMFQDQMMAKFAEDDRLEQMNAQKRRMKVQEHKRAIERLIAEKREKIAREKEENEMEQKVLQEMANERQKIIEEERQKLLQEHASKLLGYLPKGVIQGPKDLENLGANFQAAYSKRCEDPLEEC
ncbi:meiosis-specific nuclear structural protein 1 isoform X1 [Octopus bimaculoides]|uniref:Meiosis-specific nuclear structural protein 1 n=2 Tax=Octopus bimaculoides TaxID=37653 RepID=A0A0L8I0I1_OCTBM|nr:meiosis-specific nuclear structural protein 1 isoform X1 [Octopus bimaculoides]|eukprot:XP_014767815.1 PREDICTED: meiosis-specific nuclear structural protein 1-like isoform X1 [Octopus bimaculoides]